jgi:hypothetical protein
MCRLKLLAADYPNHVPAGAAFTETPAALSGSVLRRIGALPWRCCRRSGCIDDMDPRLGRQIAIVEHHPRAILVGGSQQVGVPNPLDALLVGRAASPRQPSSDDTVPASRSQSRREWPNSPQTGKARCFVPVGALGFARLQHGFPETKISGEPTGNSQMGKPGVAAR